MTSPPLPFQIERKKEKFLFFSPLGFCNTFLLLQIFSPLSLSRLRLENRYYRHKKHNITDISQTRKEEKKILKRNPFICRTRMEMWRYFLRGKKGGGRRDGAEKCCCCLQPPFRALWGKGTCVEKRDLLFASLARSCCVFLFLQKPQNSHGTKKNNVFPQKVLRTG